MQQTTCSLEPAIGSRVHQHDLLSLVHKGFGKILAHQRKTWTWEVPHLSRSESLLRCWHFKNENLRCPCNTLGTIFASGCLGEVSALSSLTWHSLVIPMAVYYVRQQSFSHLCIFVCHKSVEDCCSKCPLPMIEPMSMLTQDDPSTPQSRPVSTSPVDRGLNRLHRACRWCNIVFPTQIEVIYISENLTPDGRFKKEISIGNYRVYGPQFIDRLSNAERYWQSLGKFGSWSSFLRWKGFL